MERFLYFLLSTGLGWTIAAAGFGAYLHVRLALLLGNRERKRHFYRALSKGAFSLTTAILLYRVITVGSTTPSPWAWAYTVGLLVAGYAFTGLARFAADDLAALETGEDVHEDGQKEPGEKA